MAAVVEPAQHWFGAAEVWVWALTIIVTCACNRQSRATPTECSPDLDLLWPRPACVCQHIQVQGHGQLQQSARGSQEGKHRDSEEEIKTVGPQECFT